MSFWRKIAAFVFLVLWIPATQHCDLAAAGLIAEHDEHTGSAACCENDAACSHDNCDVVESGAYKPSNNLLKVSAPDLFVCTDLLCFRIASIDLPSEPVMPVVEFDRPMEWVPTWHFDQRAAPPSRAPSILV